MTLHYQDDAVTLHAGDCLDVLRDMADTSVDAVVCDPPYNLSFMGREWDSHVSSSAFGAWCLEWSRECLRVLKPGGHMLAFGGSRTWYRLACAVEDAGFELRDSIAWVYASGFPKSLDVSKAIDKQRDDDPDRRAVGTWLRAKRESAGLRQKDVAAHWPSVTGGLTGCVANWEGGFNCPTWEQWLKLRELIGFGDEMDAEVWRLNGRKGTPGEAWDRRPITQEEKRPLASGEHIGFDQRSSTERERRDIPATDAARQWQGWGTALKPAFEPIVVARKPLTGTVAANVTTWGTGAINVDASRVGTDSTRRTQRGTTEAWEGGAFSGERVNGSDAGRWPANLVLTHAPTCTPEGAPDGGLWACADGCPVRELDKQSGVTVSALRGKQYATPATNEVYGSRENSPANPDNTYGDTGGGSRFFPTFRYEPKAPTAERPRVKAEAWCEECGHRASDHDAEGCRREYGAPDEMGPCECPGLSLPDATPTDVAHPTVKPLDLMRWLVRLVTPPDGLVLDPFAGSGTTAEACVLEGFRCVTIEREEAYLPLIVARLTKPLQPDLFGGAA